LLSRNTSANANDKHPGYAKPASKGLEVTETGQLEGTPSYESSVPLPEQETAGTRMLKRHLRG
ncbi:hypothetical protein BDN71DRAFT_1454651, partial [Pleurotus eryngii]